MSDSASTPGAPRGASLDLLAEAAETLFADQPDAVVIHWQGRIAWANGRLGSLLGLDPRTLRGAPAAQLYPEGDRARATTRLREAAGSGCPAPVAHHSLRRRDGTRVDVEAALLVLPLLDGTPLVIEVLRRVPPDAASRGAGRHVAGIQPAER